MTAEKLEREGYKNDASYVPLRGQKDFRVVEKDVLDRLFKGRRPRTNEELHQFREVLRDALLDIH